MSNNEDPYASARPTPLPTRDATGLSADELLARTPPVPPVPDEPSVTERITSGARNAVEGAALFVQQLDLPGKWRALRLGDRARHLAERGSETAKSAAAVAAPKLREAGSRVRDTVATGADKAATGLRSAATKASSVAGQASEKASVAIRDRISPQADPASVPSELDRLVARDQLDPSPVAAPGRAPSPPAAPAGLPLFAHDDPAPPAPVQPAGPPLTAAAAAAASNAAPAPQVPAAAPMPVAEQPQETPEAHDEPPVAVLDRLPAWLRQPASWAAVAGLVFMAGALFGGWWQSGRVTPVAVRAALMADPAMLPAAMAQLRDSSVAAAINERRTALERPFAGAWGGNADGDVVVTVFTDYACGFCRASEADVARLLREDREIKIVYRELPVLTADSEPAARLALAAARNGRYAAMHRTLFASDTPDRPTRIAAADNVGVSAEASALGDPAITQEIENNIALARALNIDGTPAWVVGDRLLSGAVGLPALREAIAAARTR